MSRKLFFILVILLSILAFGLRAQETISHNFLFTIDMGRDMLAVKNIVFEHHLTLIGPYTSLQGVFQGPLWYYLLAIPTFITKGDPWGSVLLMLVISMATVIIAFLGMRKFFGKKAAILTLFLFTVSPEAVAASTYSWNPHPMWFLVVVYAIAFYKVNLKSVKCHFIMWPTLSLMFHFQTALGFFLIAGTFLYFILFERKLFFHKYALFGILTASIFFIPQVLFDFRHDFLMSKSILNIITGSDQGLFVGGESTLHLDLLRRNADLFLYNFKTTFVRDGILVYAPGVFFFLLITISIYKKNLATKNKEELFFKVFIKLIFIVSFLIILYPFPVRYWFLTGFQSIYILIFGLFMSKFWNNNFGKLVISLFIVISLFYSLQKIYTLYFSIPDYGGTAKIKGKIEAIDAVYNNAKDEKFNLLVFTPPVNTDAYDYLIWWHGNSKYGYIPPKNKKGLFYLLIEKDPDKPWSYEGWIETVIKSGKVVETKQLPSGFIIQKRIE